MSNTSTVTPYDSGVGARVAAGAAAVVAGVATFLLEGVPPEVEEATRTRRKEELLHRLRGAGAHAPLHAVHLNASDPVPLVRTAERLGYRRIEGGRRLTSEAGAPILLQSSTGERLAITNNERGRLSLHGTGARKGLQRLVREHTFERAVRHLERSGMEVATARLANGELQLVGRERPGRRGGRPAELRAQVRQDGTTWVDLPAGLGPECERVVGELAEAVGGRVTTRASKGSFCQLPGEPARVRAGG